MKENLRRDFTFWLSIFAIAISAVTLILFFIKVTPNSVVDISSFIGAIATFIGISVTMVIGFQIYNALDLKRKVSVFEELEHSIELQKAQMDVMRNEQNEGACILQARIISGIYEEKGRSFDAFLKFHKAIKYALSVNHKIDGYDWMLEELKLYMLQINMTLFNMLGAVKDDDIYKAIENFKKSYKDDESEIRVHPNYKEIKDKYEELMSKFEKRLFYISQCKNVSDSELDKIIS